MGRITTVVGVALSIGTAYLAQYYNSINDLLQLVFSFVNAPLFGTFLLGMFWKRTSGHGAFCGLLSGTLAAALTHGCTMAEGKGGWITTIYEFPSSMAQNFWIAIMAWTTCFVVTILVSLVTRAAAGEGTARPGLRPDRIETRRRRELVQASRAAGHRHRRVGPDF